VGGVSEKAVADENLDELFQAVDEDGSGTIDAQELQRFLADRPCENIPNIPSPLLPCLRREHPCSTEHDDLPRQARGKQKKDDH
jgi:Ca2+-binding EF-hand superfamily protein